MPRRSQPPSPRVKKRKHSRQNSGPGPNYQYTAKAAETWMAIGSCAASMGVPHLAVKSFEAALAHSPGSLSALLRWSHMLRISDVNMNETVGCQAALQRLTKAADQYPDLTKSADFFKELTECYLLVNLNEPAQQAIQQAIQLSPKDATLFLLSAQALIRMSMRAQAASTLTHCLKLLPQTVTQLSASDVETARTAHAELAAIAAADGDIDSSITELTATLSLPPPPAARINEHVALWCALATALERANKIPEALDACESAERAVGLSPRILITHAYLLLLDETKPHAEQAVKLLTQVVEAEPRSSPKPKDDADSATEDTSGDFLPWCLLGKAYTLLDSPRAAYDSYQIALRRADASPITWLAVGKLYLELKQLPDALAAYSQALRLQLNENSPGTAAAWDGLSCVYERCDDQLGDAADACSRAALCYQTFGDSKNADFYENRAKNLRLAAQGKAPVPEWSEPVGVPNYFLRDLVNLLPHERIAFVKGINKPETAEKAHPKAPITGNGSSAASSAKPDSAKNRQTYDSQYYGDSLYAGRQQPYPYGARGGSAVSVSSSTPPPNQPQYNHPGTPSGQHPQYALAPAYKPDSKSPAVASQQMQPPQRHFWPTQEAAGAASPGHPLVRGPPHMSAQYAPPPAQVMSPPVGTSATASGPHRSPVALPQATAEGYQMAGPPPGYAYGQYVPIHGGMVAQMQPYGGAHWRR